MEQRGAVLNAIAKVLNAGGSALVNVYDAVAALKTGVGPGEKGQLRARLRDCEKKLERLYLEIGREFALREPEAPIPASGEAGIKLAAEIRAEMERIKQRLSDIEEEEKAARAAAIARARKQERPATGAAMPVAEEVSAHVAASIDTETEETGASTAPEAETPATAIDEAAPAHVSVEAEEAPADFVTEEAASPVSATEEDPTKEMEPDVQDAEPETSNEAAAVAAEEEPGVIAEPAEAPTPELPTAPFEVEALPAGEDAQDAGTETEEVAEPLEHLLKSDLLKLCQEKGIESDKRMTKVELIELLRGRL